MASTTAPPTTPFVARPRPRAGQGLRPARPTVHRVTSARPPRSAGRSRPVRLTRRGRLVVLVALVGLVFALASVGRVSLLAAGPDVAPAGPVAEQWVVQPGETLWQVAVAVAPDDDPREVVARIIELNDLPDAAVHAGQTLLVPA